MSMKKKPPPGATLVSRLKARREQQALAESNAKQAAANSESAEVASPPPAAEVEPEAPAKDEGKSAVKPKAAVAEKVSPVITPEVVTTVDESVTVTQSAQSSAPPVEVKETRTEAPARIAAPAPVQIVHDAEFVRRSISIDDLRPVSDEYENLTDEIRLAGRFAAAGLIAQGLRLSRLKDDQIYKEHYQTFEDYCRKEHSMSATYAYRLIRMSEMAERLAEDGARHISHRISDSMPDPFEVLLGLGHRHVMALLPLEFEKAEDLLIHGVPLPGESGKGAQRIPIVKATEQQIKLALRILAGGPVQQAPRKKLTVSSAVPSPPSVQTLAAMADRLEEWANWLEDNPPVELIGELMEEVKAGRIKDGKEIARLAQQLASASKRILELLEPLQRRPK